MGSLTTTTIIKGAAGLTSSPGSSARHLHGKWECNSWKTVSSSTLRSKHNVNPNNTINQIVKNLVCVVLNVTVENEHKNCTGVSRCYWSVLEHMTDVHKHTVQSESESVELARLNTFPLFSSLNKNVSKEHSLPQSSSSQYIKLYMHDPKVLHALIFHTSSAPALLENGRCSSAETPRRYSNTVLHWSACTLHFIHAD